MNADYADLTREMYSVMAEYRFSVENKTNNNQYWAGEINKIKSQLEEIKWRPKK